MFSRFRAAPSLDGPRPATALLFPSRERGGAAGAAAQRGNLPGAACGSAATDVPRHLRCVSDSAGRAAGCTVTLCQPRVPHQGALRLLEQAAL